MKTLFKSVIGAAVLTGGSISPVCSQESAGERIGEPIPAFIASLPDSQAATSDRDGYASLSAGIGFPASTGALRGRVGPGIGIFPDYEGADDYSVNALPLVDIGKPGAFFLTGADINTNDGLASAGVTIFHVTYTGKSGHNAQLLMGPLARVHGGRDEDDNRALDGLGDIDKSAGVGGFMALNAGPWAANLIAVPQDAGDGRDGFLVTFDATYITSFSDDLTLSTGLSTSWADDDYMQGYFGVTDAQTTRAGLAQFDSEAGFKDAGIQLKATYTLSKHWVVDGQVGYWRLLNDAADSPLVEDEGSVNQVRSLIGLSYRF